MANATVRKKPINNRERTTSRYFYVEYFGPIPLDHYVHHLDGNKYNYDRENLIAVPRGIYMSFCQEMKATGKLLSRREIERRIEAIYE